MYNIINREKISEPNRGQNYSEFYYTTYIVVIFQDITTIDVETIDENNEVIITQQEIVTEREHTFKFYEETEDEINIKIEEWQQIYLQGQQIITGEQPPIGL